MCYDVDSSNTATDRHISSTASAACLGLWVDQSSADAKVTQLDTTSLIHKNIWRLHVCNKSASNNDSQWTTSTSYTVSVYKLSERVVHVTGYPEEEFLQASNCNHTDNQTHNHWHCSDETVH